MGIEELAVLGLLFVVLGLGVVNFRDAPSQKDFFRLERKIDYLLKRFEVDPKDAEAVQPSAEVLDLIKAHKTIEAVKKLRQEAHLTLREAKQAVDRFRPHDRTT